VRLYLHTARFVATGSEPVALSTVLVGKSSFKVAGIRKGMSVLEYSLVLPASSSSKVVIDFERAFLHIDEHPPDANRGFDLPSPIVTFRRLSDAPAEGCASLH
jgi:phosphatidylinositol glycan class T